jgi:hypothetical protein
MHAEASALLTVVGTLRWRLGLERTTQFALRGVLLGALGVIGVSVAAWLLGPVPSGLFVRSVLLAAALPVAGGVGFALLRWPTQRQTALAADHRLSLAERLGTAVEVARRERHGRFDDLLVRDAVAHAAVARGRWLLHGQRTRREAALALGLALLAAASLALPSLPRPVLPGTSDSAAPAEAAGADAQERAALTEPAAENATTDSGSLAQSTAQADADLAARVQQQQAERSALDKLSGALGQISAGQPAADAIQRGDFADARNQLANLADEADQLSDAAKQQLARALQQAANATTATDRQLADRERQAGQALSRSTYAEQRQTLRNLADQVQRSGARSATADQLARDVGRLQQQQGGAQGQQSQAQAQQSPAQGQSDGRGATAAAAQAAGADNGGAGAGDNAQQGGPGVGTGTDPNATGDPANRLDAAGQSVSVPTRLGTGPGVRPPDGTEDQTGTDPSTTTRSVAELVQAQQTGQVAPEQNLVPGDQRPIVRGYFK